MSMRVLTGDTLYKALAEVGLIHVAANRVSRCTLDMSPGEPVTFVCVVQLHVEDLEPLAAALRRLGEELRGAGTAMDTLEGLRDIPYDTDRGDAVERHLRRPPGWPGPEPVPPGCTCRQGMFPDDVTCPVHGALRTADRRGVGPVDGAD